MYDFLKDVDFYKHYLFSFLHCDNKILQAISEKLLLSVCYWDKSLSDTSWAHSRRLKPPWYLRKLAHQKMSKYLLCKAWIINGKRKRKKKDIFLRTIHRGRLQCIKRQLCIRYEERRGLSLYSAAYRLLSHTQFFGEFCNNSGRAECWRGLGLSWQWSDRWGEWIGAWFNKPWYRLDYTGGWHCWNQKNCSADEDEKEIERISVVKS